MVSNNLKNIHAQRKKTWLAKMSIGMKTPAPKTSVRYTIVVNTARQRCLCVAISYHVRLTECLQWVGVFCYKSKRHLKVVMHFVYVLVDSSVVKKTMEEVVPRVFNHSTAEAPSQHRVPRGGARRRLHHHSTMTLRNVHVVK